MTDSIPVSTPEPVHTNEAEPEGATPMSTTETPAPPITPEPSPLDALIAETPEKETTPIPDAVTALDDIDQQIADREWVVSGDLTYFDQRAGEEKVEHWERTYVQEPLSYMAMLQFTGLIGQRIAEVMSGPDGLTIEGIVDNFDGLMNVGRNALTKGDFGGIDALVSGLAKLSAYVPGLVEDCQCIWLRVPLAERPLVKEIWSRSPAKGGLSMADGEEMLDVFLAQNYQEVEDFFVERLPRLRETAKRLRERSSSAGRRLSKRSRNSARTVPKR